MSDNGARCPIGGERVDESAAKINALIVVVVLLTAIVARAPWLLGYLVLDYAIKLVCGFAYSPNCVIAHAVASVLRLERRPIDSAPKRFAALLAGVMATVALVMAYSLHSMVWFTAVAGMFACVASLDAFAGFCVGCYLYRLLPARFSAVMIRR